MTDPWRIRNTVYTVEEEPINNRNNPEQGFFEFEDNFVPSTNTLSNGAFIKDRSDQTNQCLPDSARYLQSLERKLERTRKSCKLVEALGDRRQQSLRTLLQENQQTVSSENNELVELDTPVASSEFKVYSRQFYRHIQPVRALSQGEIVDIIKYDQLEKQVE